MNTSSTTPPEDPEGWTKPSIYSVLVIVLVLGLLGWGIHLGKLTFTEGLIGALLGVLTWVTKGARPPIANKIGPAPPPDPPPSPLPRVEMSPIPSTRDTMDTPRDPPDSRPCAAPWTALCALLVLACAPMTPQEKAAAADEAFKVDMKKCVDDAPTIEASRACRANTREAWHVDGGAR